MVGATGVSRNRTRAVLRLPPPPASGGVEHAAVVFSPPFAISLMEGAMTRRRKAKRAAYTWIGLGLVVIGVIAVTGAGRREPAGVATASVFAAVRGAEVTPGFAQADVDTLDLQLD
jgi:hypothetical protein